MTPLRVFAGLFVVTALLSLALLLGDQIGDLRAVGDQVRTFGWRLRPGWLAAALALATGNLFLMGMVWVRLFRALGGTISTREGVRVWVITNLGRYIPGKIWQLTGLTVYMKERGGDGAIALSSALVFQLVTIGTGTAVAATVLGVEATGRGPLSAPMLGAMIVLLAVALNPRILQAATRQVARWMKEPVDVRRLSIADLAGAGAGMVAAWAVYGLGLWCLVRGLGADEVGPFGLTGVFAGSYVVGYLALIAPGGLVVREGAMTVLLAGLGVLPAGAAGIIAVSARVWTTVSELVALGAVAAGRRKG